MRTLRVDDFNFDLLPRAGLLPDGEEDDNERAEIRSEEFDRINRGQQPRFIHDVAAEVVNGAFDKNSLSIWMLIEALSDWQLAPMAWWLYANNAPDHLWSAILARVFTISELFMVDHPRHVSQIYTLLKVRQGSSWYETELSGTASGRVYQADEKAGLVWHTEKDMAMRYSKSGNVYSVGIDVGNVLATISFQPSVVIDAPALGIPLRRMLA